MGKAVIGGINVEFSNADLGDRRLNKRLVKIAESLAEDPSNSIPEACDDEAALEATYRFLGNDRISAAQILAPHFDQTKQRMCAEKDVLIIHDTTDVSFSGDVIREGLAPVSSLRSGFFLHTALAVSGDGTRTPLGVGGYATYVREEPSIAKNRRKRTLTPEERKTSEARRWDALVDAVSKRFPDHEQKFIHVMDREGDNFDVLAALAANDRRFVVRLAHNREVSGVPRPTRNKRPAISDVLEKVAPFDLQVEVQLSSRSRDNARKRHIGARRARTAKLSLSSTQVKIKRSSYSFAEAEEIIVNIVRLYETEPPQGCEPIEWRLMTSEPTETIEQAQRVVDIYRARWVIEEYFKALKSGCALEKRQLENSRSIFNLLAVLAPIAWKLLLLRAVSRDENLAASKLEIDDEHLQILRVIAKDKHKHTLPRNPSAKDVMLAIAALGRHLKHNKDPGWIVLGRGYERFCAYVDGAIAMKRLLDSGVSKCGCDQ